MNFGHFFDCVLQNCIGILLGELWYILGHNCALALHGDQRSQR